MNEGLEKIVGELLSLAKKKPRSDTDLARAKNLMFELKKMGYKNREISELTDGGWSEPTVKLYTRGEKVRDPTPKENSIKILTQLVSMGLTLEDVKTTISMTADLDAEDVNLKDVSSLLGEAKRSNVSVKDLLQLHRDVKVSGLTLVQFGEVLSYKSDLDDAGFTLDGLKKVSQVSKTYGGYSKVLEAINAYSSLKAIEAEVKRVGSAKEELEKRVGGLKAEVKDLEEEKKLIESALNVYEDLKNLDFDEAALKALKKLSDRYGGVKEVLESVNTFTNLGELESKVREIETKRLDVESELKRVHAEHAHLQTIIGMCDTLLYKYKFSVSAINEIYEMAKKYGEPFEAIKALGRFGDLGALEKEVEKASTKKVELESRVKELRNQVQDYRAQMEELKNTARGQLKSITADLRKNVELLSEKSSEALDTISTKYEEFAEGLGERKAEAGRLEEELQLARVVQALIKYPSESEKYPLDYDILMLRGVMNHCRVKEVNPKIKAGDTISQKYYISSSKEFELLDLIDWAMRGLTNSVGSSR